MMESSAHVPGLMTASNNDQASCVVTLYCNCILIVLNLLSARLLHFILLYSSVHYMTYLLHVMLLMHCEL